MGNLQEIYRDVAEWYSPHHNVGDRRFDSCHSEGGYIRSRQSISIDRI